MQSPKSSPETTDDLCECRACGRMHRKLGTPPWVTAWEQLKPGDRIEYGRHRWRVEGIHLGALRQESLVEMESETHEPGWTGEWEYHPRLFVPIILLRGAKIIPQVVPRGPVHCDRPTFDDPSWVKGDES